MDCEVVTSSCEETDGSLVTFESLGLISVLVEACSRVGWHAPTPIQRKTIPLALKGRDIIGLAETGSGKTGAFTLPLLQCLLMNPQRLFGLILTPTRKLAVKIAKQIKALSSGMEVECAVVVGGIDMTQQSIALAKKPHIIIATPRHLVYHLKNTENFSLKAIKFFIMDKAEQTLDMDCERRGVRKILKMIPNHKRRTLVFSATMTCEIERLQREVLVVPVKVHIPREYKAIDEVVHYTLTLPPSFKDVNLVNLLNEGAGQSVMVICATRMGAFRVSLLLRALGIVPVLLHGKMYQSERRAALSEFKASSSRVLLATDVASCVRDIPHVDLVINYDLPTRLEDYINCVRCVARADRSGKIISFVTTRELRIVFRFWNVLEREFLPYPIGLADREGLYKRVEEAQRLVERTLRPCQLGDADPGGYSRFVV